VLWAVLLGENMLRKSVMEEVSIGWSLIVLGKSKATLTSAWLTARPC